MRISIVDCVRRSQVFLAALVGLGMLLADAATVTAGPRAERTLRRIAPRQSVYFDATIASSPKETDTKDRWQGVKILPRTPSAAIRMPDRVVAFAHETAWPQMVHAVKGDWLWVAPTKKSGWIHKREVVQLHQAAGYFDAEIAREPTGWAYAMHGLTCLREPDEALADFDGAITLDGRTAQNVLGRALALYELGQSDDAKKEAHASLEMDSECTHTRVLIATIHRDRGEYAKAIAAASDAIAAQPKDPLAYEIRASTYLKTADYLAAAADFSQVLRICPGDKNALSQRAYCYARESKNDEAIADYSETQRRYGPSFYALCGRARLWCLKNDFDKARDDYTKAIALTEPEDEKLTVEVYFWRALCGKALQDYPAAIADLSEVLRLSPDHENALLERGYCYAKIGQRAEANADLAKVAGRRGISSDEFRDLADRLYVNGEFEKARDNYSLAIATTSPDIKQALAELYLGRATCHEMLSDFFEADADHAEAARLDPTQAARWKQTSGIGGKLHRIRSGVAEAPAEGSGFFTPRNPYDVFLNSR